MSEQPAPAEWPLSRSESRTRGLFRAGQVAKMIYRRPSAGVMDVYHTFVDEAHRGRGIAQRLHREMVAFARANGRKVIATCPFVKAMFERHPEDSDVLVSAAASG